MPQATLETVTLQTLAQAAKAAGQAVAACRTGGHRLIDVLDTRVTEPAVARTERFLPRLARAVRRSSARAQALAVQGVDRVTERAGAAVEGGSARAANQVKRMARLAFRVQSPVLSRSLDAAARLSLPSAQAALALTARVAAVADRLPGAKAPARKAAPRKAGGGQTGASRAVRKAVAARPVVAKPAAAPAAAPKTFTMAVSKVEAKPAGKPAAKAAKTTKRVAASKTAPAA